jgi:hypothetical protein
MSTYNDNLHNSVVSSLSEQEIALQSITAQYNAAEDTLYYRQSNRVTTFERLELANQALNFYQEARDKTVESNNRAINVQDAAVKSKSYLNKTVSNTSAAAANVQVASNAILRLASDVGSIFSIVNAANFESEIYYLSLRCKERMDETAFNAEAVSDTSMKATASVSQVPINDLTKRTNDVNAVIQELQAAVNAEYDKANGKVKSESAKLEVATNAEKKAEGELLVKQREYNSTRIAYNITNRELNLDLGVFGIETAVSVADQTGEVIINFNDYQSPFSDPSKLIENNPGIYKTTPYYPVDEYYLFVVKFQKESTFVLSNAEEIVTQYPLKDDKGNNNTDVRYAIITREDIKSPKIVENVVLKLQGDPTKPFDPSKDNTECQQLDSDGDPIVLGDQYVVFAMGVFDSKYKKAINNYEDYLTGASENFSLKVVMNKAYDIEQAVEENEGDEQVENMSIKFTADDKNILEELRKLGVSDQEILDNPPVHYRCMFLPVLTKNVHNVLLSKSMLTRLELIKMAIDTTQENNRSKVYSSKSLSDELGRIADLDVSLISEEENLDIEITKEITKLEATIKKLKQEIDAKDKKIDPLQKKIDRLEQRIKKAKDEQEKEKLESQKAEEERELESLRASMGEMSQESKNLNDEVDNKKEAQENLKKDIELRKNAINVFKSENELGFLFDDTIASKIPASNYTKAEYIPPLMKEKLGSYIVAFKPETTDNFGNRLIKNNCYLPVVLAVFDPGNSNKNKFGIALSMAESYITYK